MRQVWQLLRDSVNAFIEDEALSRGAAIAYYTIFSIAPVLVIVIAIAGIAYGPDAARGAIVGQLEGMIGHDGALAVQDMVRSAANRSSGVLATILGVVTLLVTATGVFGEMQASLNMIWRASAADAAPADTSTAATVSRLVRARAASLGLVAALGFLLMVSLTISAVMGVVGERLGHVLPDADLLVHVVNFVISLVLVAVLFGAIYKVLPDKPIAWRDVLAGSLATALLFTIGKTVIGLYIGSSKVASSYGAAGALVVVLLWVYYSAQIFLFGAEFTKVYARRHGSHAAGGENAHHAA